MYKSLIILILSSGLALSGCSSTPDQPEKKITELSAQELFDRATSSTRGGNYVRSIQLLEEIDTRYPFGRISEQAKLNLVYAYFKAGDYESGQSLADRFLRQHPQHASADYVYYMKGVMYFEKERGFLKEIFNANVEKRDTSSLKASFGNFHALVQAYPDSQYAPDARKRMIQLRNLLAEHELHVARYYMARDGYIGAANRAKYIVENYPKTPAIPEALNILVTSYNILEIPELAEQYRRVLLMNYPNFNITE